MKNNKEGFDWTMLLQLLHLLFWIIMLISIIFAFVKAGFPLPFSMENYPYWMECVLSVAIYLLFAMMFFLCFFISSYLRCIKILVKLKSEHKKGVDKE